MGSRHATFEHGNVSSILIVSISRSNMIKDEKMESVIAIGVTAALTIMLTVFVWEKTRTGRISYTVFNVISGSLLIAFLSHTAIEHSARLAELKANEVNFQEMRTKHINCITKQYNKEVQTLCARPNGTETIEIYDTDYNYYSFTVRDSMTRKVLATQNHVPEWWPEYNQ
jgi:hypothetical protein